jgi:hypothetical protein
MTTSTESSGAKVGLVAGLFSKTFAACQGRHTFFTIAFFLTGNVMHWFHRLDGTYITFMGTLMGFVLGHSVQENHFDVKNNQSTP